MPLLGKILLGSSVILALAAIYVSFPAVRNFIEKPAILHALTALIVIANFVLAWETYQSNKRAEQFFAGEIRPLIDVTPIGIAEVPVAEGGTQVTTVFSVANYSGFTAYKVGIDLKYGDSSWILEWRKAHTERIQKGVSKGIVLGKLYESAPGFDIPKLEPGATTNYPGITGSLSLEGSICASGTKGFPIWVRVTWRNEKDHIFDEIHKYKVICTKDADQGPNEGISFTFIPEGIVSQKATGASGKMIDQ